MWETGFLIPGNSTYLFIRALIQLVWSLFSPLIAMLCYIEAKHRDGIPRLFFNAFAIITIVHGVGCIINIPEMLWVIIPVSFIAILFIFIIQGEVRNA